MAEADSLREQVVIRNEELIGLLLEECLAAGSQAKWAAIHGVSPQFVSDVLKGNRPPSGKLLRGLGLRRDITYVPREPEAVS